MGMYKLNKNQYVCQKEPAKAFLLLFELKKHLTKFLLCCMIVIQI